MIICATARTKSLALLCVAGLILTLLGGCATLAGSDAAVLRAKDKVAPALVHIRPVKEVYAQGEREEVLIVGSGFIITADGYVVTNEHVAGESRFVRCVLSDKTEVEAKVVGVDPFTDIALLKLDTDRKLPFVRMGDSDQIQAGQTVLALGSPHGLARSVSMGIISVTDRYLDEGTRLSPYNNWIQTDAAINPGNSGGPLVDLAGRVIGVNARVLRGAENVGFAIPINVAREVVAAIIKDGRVRRAWIGIELQEMLARTDDPAQQGVVIADIDPLSPAATAGIAPGDILVAVNGQAVNARFEEDLPRVRKLLADLPIGTPAALTLRRADGDEKIEVAPVERSEFRGEELAFPEWGFTASELTDEQVRRAQLPARMGIYISGTRVGGPAGNARLERGDIILQVDGNPVANLAEFRQFYDQRIASKQKLVLLFVRRGALTRYAIIEQNASAGAANPAQPEGAAEEGEPGHAP